MHKLSLILLLILSLSDQVFPSSGDLDPSFDIDGKVTTDFAGGDDIGESLVLQPDGKIVVAGYMDNGSNMDFGLARYNPDGSLDSSFGIGGKVITDFATSNDRANAVLIQTDGKIIAVGDSSISSSDFALARYNPDGSLDSTFGIGGKVTTDFNAGSSDAVFAAALQSDGKIIAAGNSPGSGGSTDFAVARYNPDGSLDLTFGVGGKATTDFAGGTDQGFAVALQVDGKIVLAGNAYTGQAWDFALARFNTDGSLDLGFGGDGKVTTQLSQTNNWANAVTVQPDGKIVAVGWAGVFDFALVRYETDGSLDFTFDGDGIVITDFGGGEEGHGVVLQTDGKIIAVGSADGVSSDFALARYNIDGSLDNSFSLDGKVTTDFGSGYDVAIAVALQSDGNIVVSGYSDNGSNQDFAIARYLGDSCSLFCDDFEDGVLASDWTYVKPQWTEAGGGLVGTPIGRKAETIATPVFSGCTLCNVQVSMSTAGGIGNRLWLLAWYQDKGNTIELLMKEENDKWILKQRSGGSVVAKTKGLATILPNASYNVEISFDGSTFTLMVDGITLATLPAFSAPNGTVGFRTKNTTAQFGYITVN